MSIVPQSKPSRPPPQIRISPSSSSPGSAVLDSQGRNGGGHFASRVKVRGDPRKRQWFSTVPRASVTVPYPPASREGFRNPRGCGSLEPCGRGGSGLLPWRVHELREIGPFGQVPQSSVGGGVSSGKGRGPSIVIFFVWRIDGEKGRFLRSNPARLRG